MTAPATFADRLREGLQRAQAERAEFESAVASFPTFLGFWSFRDRESGEVMTFSEATLWEGQRVFVEALARHRWLFALKAGKLGFSELAVAYDAWRAFSQTGARVSVFSKTLESAKELLRYVRFGLTHLPSAWGVEILSNVAGGDTDVSLRFSSRFFGPDDQRTVVSHPATDSASIDQSVAHAHLDELAHVERPERLYSAVATTVAPGGSLLITTRGSGEGFCADLFRQASDGLAGDLFALFCPYWMRPGRDAVWRAQEEARNPLPGAIGRYAPVDAEDALRGDLQLSFVEGVWWDACFDASIPPLVPGDRTPLVVGVDAGVTSDTFAIVAVSRHHERHDEVSVRAVRVFDPKDAVGGVVDFGEADRWLRAFIASHNVILVSYDSYQLVGMMQGLLSDRVVWARQFPQGSDRIAADSALRRDIVERKVHHPNDPVLSEHVRWAGMKPQPSDAGLRIVKLHPMRKIDSVVALSMARAKCLYLML